MGKFSQLKKLLPSAHTDLPLDACLLDAGLSSMQLAEAQRGFSLSKYIGIFILNFILYVSKYNQLIQFFKVSYSFKLTWLY